MSPNGQAMSGVPAAIVVSTFPMPRGRVFAWHTHPSHQLAWSARGVLTVRQQTQTWVLPPTRALWIPAGTEHETAAFGHAVLRTLYQKPNQCRVDWTEPRPVMVTQLLASLIDHLADPRLVGPGRVRAEALVPDLLQPLPTVTIDVPMPTDERARDVARALSTQPGDRRNLEQWGHEVGASARTLARAFLADTGLTFGRWRTALRLNAALPRLAAGDPVSTVADAVGYQTPSAFIAAFRHQTGTTPGAYFSSTRGHPVVLAEV